MDSENAAIDNATDNAKDISDGFSSTGSDNGNADKPSGGKLSLRNLILFPLGCVGRDFLYNLFNGYLLTYILFTKTLTDAQFASVSIIIICARIFDAFNDPVMGGIVENTRTKWGKFKPWILIGAVTSAIVVAVIFSVNLSGWAFIGFLAFIYFMFSITFTMNDIPYWGMLPSLSKNENDRSKLTSFTQLCASAGSAIVSVVVPAFTAGQWTIGGSASTAYMVFGILAGVFMIGFQLITVLGVKEEPLEKSFVKTPKKGVKEMFKIIFKNDQLLWSALVMLIFNIGTNVVGGGLSLSYIYFEFGYNGILTTIFGIAFAVVSVVFMLTYPILIKKFGRKKLMYATGFSIIGGYLLMLLFGLVLPSDPWLVKFIVLILCNGIVGFGQGFYTIMLVYMADTVEYNEWKTGSRDEGLIFSVRPFTAKMGSALMQFLVMLVYLIVGVTVETNKIADLENHAAQGVISADDKLAGIADVINSVPDYKIMALLCCMCLIPVAFLIVAMLIYKRKCIIDNEFYRKMVDEIENHTSPYYLALNEAGAQAVCKTNESEAANGQENIIDADLNDMADKNALPDGESAAGFTGLTDGKDSRISESFLSTDGVSSLSDDGKLPPDGVDVPTKKQRIEDNKDK